MNLFIYNNIYIYILYILVNALILSTFESNKNFFGVWEFKFVPSPPLVELPVVSPIFNWAIHTYNRYIYIRVEGDDVGVILGVDAFDKLARVGLILLFYIIIL